MLACAFSLVLVTLVGESTYVSAIGALPWIFAASLFRSNPEHGYAALCAAMTVPGLLFGGGLEFGHAHYLENFLMARVEMTVLGRNTFFQQPKNYIFLSFLLVLFVLPLTCYHGRSGAVPVD